MRQSALIAAVWLNIVALGLWLGAMVGIGALVAPTAFRVAREQAGLILGESFRLLNYFGLGCALAVALATALEAWAWRLTPAALWRLALVGAAAALAAYLGWSLFPQMEALRAAGQMGEFDRLHTHYEQVSHAQLALLLGGALATVWSLVRFGNPSRDREGARTQSRTSEPESASAPEFALPHGHGSDTDARES